MAYSMKMSCAAIFAVCGVLAVKSKNGDMSLKNKLPSAQEVRDLQATAFGNGGVRGSNTIQSTQYSNVDASGYVADAQGTTDQTTTTSGTGFVDTNKGRVNGATTASITGTTYGYSRTDDFDTLAAAADTFSQADMGAIGAFGGGFTAVPEGNNTVSGPTGGFGVSSGSAGLYSYAGSNNGPAQSGFGYADAVTTGSVNVNSVLTATNGEDSAAGSGSGTINGSSYAATISDDISSYASSFNDVDTGFANYGVGVAGAAVTVALPGAPAGSPGTTFGSGGVRGSNTILSSQYSDADTFGYSVQSIGNTDQTTTGTSAGAANTGKGTVNGSTTASVTGTTNSYSDTVSASGYGNADTFSAADLAGSGAFGGGFTAVPEPTITDTTPEQGQTLLPFIVLADPFATTSSTTDPAPGPTGGVGLSSGAAGLFSYANAGDGDDTSAYAITTGSVNVNSVLTATNGEGSAGGSGSGTINGSSDADVDSEAYSAYATSTNDLDTSFSNYGVGVFGAAVTVGLPTTPVAIPLPGLP